MASTTSLAGKSRPAMSRATGTPAMKASTTASTATRRDRRTGIRTFSSGMVPLLTAVFFGIYLTTVRGCYLELLLGTYSVGRLRPLIRSSPGCSHYFLTGLKPYFSKTCIPSGEAR